MSGVVLNDTDNGSSVRVQPSEEVVLELQENPTTGYRWTIETTGDAIKEIESTYVASSGAIGGAGLRSIRFVGARPGTADIHGTLRRPWEASDRSLKQFDVTIIVEGDPDANDQ